MFRGIALGGGGVRAGLQLGALKALEQRQGHLQFPDGFWGCSAGAVLATGLAFNLSVTQLTSLFQSHLSLTNVLPPVRLRDVADLPTTKGLFSMDTYAETLVSAFGSQGVDLRGKTIADAPHPLHILASNLTTQTPVVFAKRVPILDALLCSSCLPFVFTPQILYNNVYVDGGVMIDCLDTIVPEECLVLHISEMAASVYPSHLAEMDLSSFLYAVYRSSRHRPTGRNVMWLRNASVSILQELSPEEKDALLAEGYSQALAFLSKRFPQELENGGSRTLPVVGGEE
jgi:NTE family protein